MIQLDAEEVTVTVDWTVLDSECGQRHVPIGYTFRRSTTTMGEWISSQVVLQKVATQPVYLYEGFGGDAGRRPNQGLEQL
jgi:hypothetical protein